MRRSSKFHENKWKARIVRMLRSTGAAVLSLHGHAQQQAGWPDIYVASPIWTGWLELKREGGRLSEAQRIILRRLSRSAAVYVLEADGSYDLCSVSTHDGTILVGQMAVRAGKDVLRTLSHL